MVTEVSDESEGSIVEQIISCIDGEQHFVLDAGAGSGKTWTLVQVLKYILENKIEPLKLHGKKIACITFTNVAKDEIRERINDNPQVFVGTIHEFLWDLIKSYESELKKILIDRNKKSDKRIDQLEERLANQSLTYSQYGRNYSEGQLYHDDVIELSYDLFKKYPKIIKIVSSQFPYILVDEYQDTAPKTVDILVGELIQHKSNKTLVGFFGDSMQKIYGHGVGEISHEQLKNITKKENFRSSPEIVELLNKVRANLTQMPSGESSPGSIVFYSSNNTSPDGVYEKVKAHLKVNGWDFENDDTKVLMLTHRSIAKELDFEKLYEAFDEIPFGRDRLYNMENPYSEYLGKIERIVSLYDKRKYRQFLQLLGIEGFKIKKHKDKVSLKELIDQLKKIRKEGRVEEVLSFIKSSNLLKRSERVENFLASIKKEELSSTEKRKKRLYEKLMKVNYQEVINFKEYIDDYTPFSTKHGIKGEEFKNVLVVIDDNSWTMYNFEQVFSNDRSNDGRYKRTLNLLYVCLSRAITNLAVLSLSNQGSRAMDTIADWFGEENIYDVSSISMI